MGFLARLCTALVHDLFSHEVSFALLLLGRLMDRDWWVDKNWRRFIRLQYAVVYTWLCGKRWIQPSTVMFAPLSLQLVACFASLLLDTFIFVASAVWRCRTEGWPHGPWYGASVCKWSLPAMENGPGYIGC